MKPKKITNEKPLKIDKSFDEALKALADPPKKSKNIIVERLRKKK